NQGAENRASRPMAGQIRRNPPGLPRVPRLGSRSYLRPISRCRPLTDTSPGRLLGGLAIAGEPIALPLMWAFRTRNRVESGARRAIANWWISNRGGQSAGGYSDPSIDQNMVTHGLRLARA